MRWYRLRKSLRYRLRKSLRYRLRKSLRLPESVLLCLLLCSSSVFAQKQYRLQVMPVDKDAAFIQNQLQLPETFNNRILCMEYVGKLPALLKTRGYVTASVDSFAAGNDTGTVWLFTGEQYKWARINTAGTDDTLLQAVGWNDKRVTNELLNFEQVYALQQRMLDYYQERGYPFARIALDSIAINGNEVSATLMTHRGPLHHIDSIKLFGKAKISKSFLQRHLSIVNGSLYKRSVLQNVSRKISELPYVQEQFPNNITMLAGSSVLNLYLQPKKSSQVNVLLGLIPAPSPNGLPQQGNKLLVTGDANILLNNALSQGETIGLIYQQLAPRSPRLNILYRHPFIFRSPLGIDFSFEMYKRDSAWLNLDVQAGVRYQLGPNQSGRIFFQHLKTNAYPDTAVLLVTRKLPVNLDVKVYNLGLQYEFNNTDYRRNPRSGNELNLLTAFGTKQIPLNNAITELKDPANPGYKFSSLYDTLKRNSYQLKLKLQAAHYFRLSKAGVLKTAINGGWLQSGNYLRNELYQVGGFKLLRGFDEESQFANRYAVATAEYRFLTGADSYFFVFADGGYTANQSIKPTIAHTYLGTGLGLNFSTPAGLFNISFAVGTRDDIPLGLKQAKIHFGYVNVF
jgi:outer membrane protein assembly factor BamA